MSSARRSPAAPVERSARTSRPPRSVPTARRAGRFALFVAAVAAALATAGPFALRPFVDAAGAAGEVAVAFVVDLGPAGGEVTGCVKVPSGANRYDALTAFLAAKGLAAPTYAASGLLCSINGIPTSGCGEVVPGGYVYWAYYTGNGHKWVYSSAGAFAPVGTADVEGWRFQDPGTGRPNDPPPPTRPRYASLCPPAPPPTTTTTRPTHPAAGHRTTTTAASGSSTTRPGKGGTTTTTTTGTTVAGINSSPRAGSSADSSGGSSSDSTDTTFPPNPVVKTAPAVATRTGPNLASVVLAVLLIAGLVVAAIVRWRKRPRAP